MQRTATTTTPRPLALPAEVPADAGAGPRAPVDVPSEQLWRDAIQATRRAATAAAELRRALQASRGPGGEGPAA